MVCDCSYIGSEIKKIRKYRKISQKKLSLMTGISEESLRRIENSHNNPRVDNFVDILEVLGIDFEMIFMDDSGSSWAGVKKHIREIDQDLDNICFSKLKERILDLDKLNESIPPTYQKKLNQYILYYKASCAIDIDRDYPRARDLLKEALLISGKDIDCGFASFYSDIELRVLIKLAETLSLGGDLDKANLVLKHLMTSIDQSNPRHIDTLYIQAKHYYQLNDYQKSASMCESAIKACCEINNFSHITLFYYLLGISKLRLGKKTYKNYINKSLSLCDLLNKPSLRLRIEENVRNISKEI